MKKPEQEEMKEFVLKIPGITLTAQEEEALQAALKVLTSQSDQLGLLDPLDAEPATLFFAEEETR
jgi:hypothetical protein